MASAAELILLFKAEGADAVERSVKGIASGAEQSTGKVGGLASKLGGLGTIAAAGAAAGGAAILGFGAMAVSAASDVAESQNKVNVVFGESAGKIDELAATAASSLGQTKGEVLAAAGGIGNLLTAMGQGKDEAADMSIQMVKLAADLGSFNNASSAEVLEAMQAAMAGETDGMKKYGVAINEATLKAAAMKAGLGDNVQALSAAEKQMLSMNIMMEQTTSAQGDFANTSDGMANSMKIIKANVADAAASIGGVLLPVVQPLISKVAELAKGLGDHLSPIIKTVEESFATAKEYGMGFSDTLALILENLGFEDAALAISDLSNAFAGIGESSGGVLTTIKDAVMGIDWAGIKDTVGGMFATLGEAIAGIDWAALGEAFMNIAGSVASFVGDGLTALVDGFKIVGPIIAEVAGFVVMLYGKFAEFLMPILSTVFGFIADHSGIFLTIGGVIAALAGGPLVAIVGALIAVGAAVPPVIEFFGSLGDKVAELAAWIGEKWIEIKDWIFGKLAEIAGELQVRWDAYMALISAVLSAIKDYVLAKWTAIKEDILSALEGIRVFISQKWDAIKEYLTGKLEQIKAAIFLVWTEIKDAIGEKLAAIAETVTNKWEEVKAITEAKLDQAKAAVMAIWQAIKDAIGEKLAAIADAVSQKWEDIKATASAKLSEMSENIRQKFEEIRAKIADAWDNIKRAFSEAWDRIKEVINLDELIAKFTGFKDRFTTIGSDLIDGLKAGVSKGWDTLRAWMEGLFGDLIALAKKILGIASPSKVMAEEIGEPMALGIVMGMQAGLSANPIVGIVEDWTKALKPGGLAKLITPILGSGIGAALVAAMAASAGKAPEQVSSRGAYWADGVQGSRTGIQPGNMGKSPDDGRVRADAFHSGKGGHLAASSSNYWQVFVAKWGVPTEQSARKVSRQLGIPLPQWLLDIYNPPQGETVDAPDVLKDPAPAQEAGTALQHLAKVAQEVADALKAVPVKFALEVDKAVGAIGKAIGGLDDLIPRLGDSNPRMRPLPPGGIGGPIVIDPPGGTSTFGAGGGYGTGSVMLATQTVNLAGPVNVGFTGTFQVGGGRSLAVELVDALIADTGTFDKLIRAEDNRRAQKP